MIAIPLLSIVSLAAGAAVPAGHAYQAPGSGDARSPCPGLNSLANHGFLPRSGKGMTVPILIKGLKDGMNVGADFASSIGALGMLSAPNLLATSFDLDNLDEHNFPIEHDGSLSRGDFYSGNDYSFNQGLFDQVLAFYKDTDVTTIPLASQARYQRIKNARAINPTFIYGARQLTLSYGETALYMSVMGDPNTGRAPIPYVKSLFEKERLPYEQGWTKPAAETNLLTLGNLIFQLQLANPEAVPEGLTLGEGTLRDVYQLKDPITGKLINSTCALAGLC